MTRAPRTRCVHGPAAATPPNRGASPAVHPASVYAFDDLASTVAAFTDLRAGYLYSRHDHPTGVHTEARIADLEGADDAVLFSSGMGALAGCLHAFAGAGGHVLAARELYGGTRVLLEAWSRAPGNELEWLDPAGPAGPEAQRPAAGVAGRVRPDTRMVLLETPTNPLLRVVDVARVRAGLAGPVLVVDGTLGTPLGRRLLEHGADVVVHSATKYLGGHDDLLAGVASGRAEVTAPLREARKVFGAAADPQTAWLLDRGLKTLAVRWERQCAGAAALAARLEADPRVEAAHYPGLAGHPDHAVAASVYPDGGAMVSFSVPGGAAAAARVYDAVALWGRMPSLGGVESTLVHPATSSHRALSAEERAAQDIGDGLLRLSVGIEDADDLWSDLDAALGAAQG